MTFIEEVAVSLTDVAKRAGLTVDEVKAEAAALNMFVGEDWRHQEALSAKDAFMLLDGSARRNLERENAWHAHMAALEQWQAERENVRRAAFNAAWEANVKHGYGSSASTDKAHAAAREATAGFDKTHPEPVFAEPPESRLQRVIARVKAGTR
jgi:hypothetical protein